MRAIRGCRHYFFCAAWGPWPPPCPPAPGRARKENSPWDAPRWTRAPAARGDKVVRFRHHRASEAETQTWACRSQRPQGGAANLAATLRGRPLRSDEVLVRCRVLAPERLDTSCTCRTMQTRTCGTCTCGWGLQTSPKKRASAVSVSEFEPAARRPLAGDMSAACLRFQDLGELGAAGRKRLPFHVSRKKQGRGAETPAAGRRRIWDLAATVHAVSQSVPLPVFLCYGTTAQDLTSRGTASAPDYPLDTSKAETVPSLTRASSGDQHHTQHHLLSTDHLRSLPIHPWPRLATDIQVPLPPGSGRGIRFRLVSLRGVAWGARC